MELHRVDADVKLPRHLGIPQAPRRELNHPCSLGESGRAFVWPRSCSECLRRKRSEFGNRLPGLTANGLTRRPGFLPRRSGCTAMARGISQPRRRGRSLSWTRLALFAAPIRCGRNASLGSRSCMDNAPGNAARDLERMARSPGARIVARAARSIIVHDEARAASLQAWRRRANGTPSRPAGQPRSNCGTEPRVADLRRTARPRRCP
jgi:hypothetical protein